MTSGSKQTRLRGRLESIRFEKDGFLIGALDGGQVVKGYLFGPQLGLEYALTGNSVTDPKWGRQFVFSDYEVFLPTDAAAICEYLVESAKWIGPVIAKRLLDAYGEQTLAVCKDDPETVAREIKGISGKRATEIAAKLRENEAHEQLQLALKKIFQNVLISRRAIGRIVKLWGADAPARIKADPYALIEMVEGIGFTLADGIARQVGCAMDGPARIRAGLLHVLKEKAFGDGHTCLTRTQLVEDTVRLLDVEVGKVTAQVEPLAESEQVITDGDVVYLENLYQAEVTVARRLRKLATQELAPGNADYEGLADDQKEALAKAVGAGVFILTGAPGTGKTYTIRRMLTSFPKATIALAAPTGKAAKRMAELTGRTAQTIHRLLEPRPAPGGGYVFTRDRKNPIDADLLVLDEVSMIDISLMAKLLDAVATGTRVILVGDTYQLPSVGPGNVLKDLIGSGTIASTELTVIKRQDEGLIVRNCHRIKAGEDIELHTGDAGDFFFLRREDPEDIRETLLELVSERLPQRYSVDPLGDIQVITPLRERGDLSCKTFNQLFQEGLNPEPLLQGLRFKVGDKVIQTRNRYDLDILNGDIGYVAEFSKDRRHLTVRFDNPRRWVELPVHENELELAYAITCHKFQGSEAPIIVVPLHRSMGSFLLQRSWLYTAVSRAQRLCVLVGQREVARETIRRNPQHRRYSRLAERLR